MDNKTQVASGSSKRILHYSDSKELDIWPLSGITKEEQSLSTMSYLTRFLDLKFKSLNIYLYLLKYTIYMNKVSKRLI